MCMCVCVCVLAGLCVSVCAHVYEHVLKYLDTLLHGHVVLTTLDVEVCPTHLYIVKINWYQHNIYIVGSIMYSSSNRET